MPSDPVHPARAALFWLLCASALAVPCALAPSGLFSMNASTENSIETIAPFFITLVCVITLIASGVYHRSWKVPLLIALMAIPVAFGTIFVNIAESIGKLPH